jgi:phosphohistidine phosphatase
MKTLLLIRHAKSSWNDSSLPDIERPLNDRGKSDAPMMAQRLIEKKLDIDLFITSPAKRARKTCEKFMKEFKIDEENAVIEPGLYEAGEEDFYAVIEAIDNRHNVAALFSHNPGLTYFVNLLTDTRVNNVPTCGIFAVRLHEDDWATIKTGKKEFLFFDIPRAGAD